MTSSMISGIAVMVVSGTAAHAADPSSESSVAEVVVTGTRIPSANLSSISPVNTVSSTELKLQGTTNIIDMIDNLPQVLPDFGNYESNGASGTATINLRGLGNKRTMVLVNGVRLQPGDPVGGTFSSVAPDIDMIPTGLVDRVEVLTGGASAVYGSDAVAGVVNFIMKKNFQGLQLDGEVSGAQDSNTVSKQIRTANAPSARWRHRRRHPRSRPAAAPAPAPKDGCTRPVAPTPAMTTTSWGRRWMACCRARGRPSTSRHITICSGPILATRRASSRPMKSTST
jgi:outer membrane receptor protein involved in Fe transport